MTENPFNITFGKEPYSIISRNEDLGKIYSSFESENPNSDVYILTGIRGSGKTVSMNTVFDHYKKQKNWICVELNPEADMLEQLASKIYDEGKLKKLFLKAEFSFSFKGVGISITGEKPVVSISSLLKREFEYLTKKDMKVLIAVDEAVSNTNMKVFAHEFQSFLREKYQVRLIMTGLYQNISLLENQKSLTFLYRAPKIYLGELNLLSISNSYKNIFNITDKESIALAKLTAGYAYAYQLLGNILFEEKKSKADKKILEEFDELLYANAYNIIYKELTNKEKEILKCACSNNSNDYIISNAKVSKSQLSSYKKALSLKGIIKPDKSKIIFTLPRFEIFLNFIKELGE